MFRKQPSRPAAVREGGHSIAGGEASATSWACGRRVANGPGRGHSHPYPLSCGSEHGHIGKSITVRVLWVFFHLRKKSLPSIFT